MWRGEAGGATPPHRAFFQPIPHAGTRLRGSVPVRLRRQLFRRKPQIETRSASRARALPHNNPFDEGALAPHQALPPCVCALPEETIAIRTAQLVIHPSLGLPPGPGAPQEPQRVCHESHLAFHERI